MDSATLVLERLARLRPEQEGELLVGDPAAPVEVDAVLMAPDGGSGLNPIGYYDDVLVRTEQGWRIQRRTFTSVHFQVFD